MADDPKAGELTTINYHWTLPTVGQSDDAWGDFLNQDLIGIDSTVKSVSNTANAAYPASNPAGYITAAAIPAPYTLPVATTTVLGGVKADGTSIRVAGDGTLSGSSVIGVTDGSNAAPGQIGEVISSVVVSPGVSLGNGVAANITSIALTAGDWDVQGEIWMSTIAPAIVSLVCWISPTSNTSGPQAALNGARFTIGGAAGFINNGAFPLRTARVSLSAPATYYLGATATGGATNAAFGNIWARRMR